MSAAKGIEPVAIPLRTLWLALSYLQVTCKTFYCLDIQKAKPEKNLIN